MNCREAHNWLLQADDPRPECCPSIAVAEHLAGCAACRSLAAEVVQLEESWRALPVPGEAEASRQAFLNRLARPTIPRMRPAGQGMSRMVHWAVAALLLLGVGVALWSLTPTPQAVAAPVLIEQLVDWNLDLAKASTPAERDRIYVAQQATFARVAKKSDLPPEERDLVVLLLENGSWLAVNSDPLGEAEHFSSVADKLVERLESAATGQDAVAVKRYAKLQGLVAERGVGVNLAKIEESGTLNFDNERRLEKVVLRDSRRIHQLVDLMERNPELSRKEIRQFLRLPSKSNRNPPAAMSLSVEARDGSFEVGQPITYVVTVRNGGAAPLPKGGRLIVVLPEAVEFASARGPTKYSRDGRHLLFRPITALPAGAELRYEIQVKPQHAGLVRCRAEVRSKQLGNRPLLSENELTVRGE